MTKSIGFGVAAALALALVAPAAGASSGSANCPLKPGSPSGGDVQWAFSDSGRPAGGAIKSSYVHGRGHWTSGSATGTVCTMDTPAKTGVVRDLVLAVSGKSKLAGRVTENGLLGVRLVLPVRVSATDDNRCAKGATGTITLFASYYSIHRDTMQVHFKSRCTGHNLSYSGSSLHVYIARNGAQVNSP